MGIFNVGQKVALRSSPYARTMTIEKVNDDGTYLCFWRERKKLRGKGVVEKHYRQDIAEALLMIPPSRAITMIDHRNLR